VPRRLIQLFTGLVLYGISDSMLLLAGLGVDPWDVLHQGLARHTSVPTGTWAIIVGAVVLLLWIPLRQRPGPAACTHRGRNTGPGSPARHPESAREPGPQPSRRHNATVLTVSMWHCDGSRRAATVVIAGAVPAERRWLSRLTEARGPRAYVASAR